MSGELVFEPVLPLWWILTPAVLAGLISAYAGWHRPFWLLLRILFIAVIAFLALGPQRLHVDREYLGDIALLVHDKTTSMQMGDRANTASIAAGQVREFAENDPSLELLEISVADHPDGSRLHQGILDGLSQIPAGRLAGVVVLGDGISHDTETRVSPDAPVHGLIVGDLERGDRSLRLLEAPKFGIVGEEVTFSIQVDQFGQDNVDDDTAIVTLQIAKQPPLQARVQTGLPVAVSLPLTSRGSNLVEINVQAAGEELSMFNNRVAVEVTGVRERLRVLLVTGEPYAGVRAWRNLLKSDPAVDLVHFTILRPPTKRDPTPLDEMALIAFPTRELFVNKLESFDLIIFDRYTRRGVLPLLYIENVTRYVERGGALLVAAGPPFAGTGSMARTFLAGILPARPDEQVYNKPYKPTISEIGKRHPVTSALRKEEKNWGRWGRVLGAHEITGQTVMETSDGEPLLVLDRVGDGRVALLLSDQAWLWSRGFEGGGPQFALYRRLAHWLMKEPELEEEALKGRIVDDSLHITMQTLQEQAPLVEVEDPAGELKKVQLVSQSPGVFTGSLPVDLNTGLLSLKSGELLAVASRGQLNLPEYASLKPELQTWEKLGKHSGGHTISLPHARTHFNLRRTRPSDRQYGRNWLGLRQNRFSVASNFTYHPLMPAYLYLLLALMLAALMWWREGKE